jgi:hypothetical protein
LDLALPLVEELFLNHRNSRIVLSHVAHCITSPATDH